MSSAAFVLGYIMDILFGDPHWLPHPVRLIGRLIVWLERKLFPIGKERNPKKELRNGTIMAILVAAMVFVSTLLIIKAAYLIHPFLGLLAETVMTYQILAAGSLKRESMAVYRCLADGDLYAARKAVSMIVGRDTENLSGEGVTKAAVETVAENASDGVIAPMIYTALGGPALGMLYKAVNTMDSMVGYKNDRYLYFGRAAARLDDIVNFIPSRICACLMILAAFLGGSDLSGREALRIYKRDRKNHSSPNSAQTESACAGALGVRLAGNASYFGKTVEKPFIGDPSRSIEYDDIRRANRLMYLTALEGEMLCLIIMNMI